MTRTWPLLLLLLPMITPPSLTAQEPPVEENPAERTIHVPRGWEGAYKFGYAPVIRVGETVILSGVAAGGEGTYEERLRGMYQRAQELLEAAGATLEDVVELTSFHSVPKNPDEFHAEFDRFMPVHKEFFPEHPPAWSAVGVTTLLSRTAVVEVRFVAVIGSGENSKVEFEAPPEDPESEEAEGAGQ